MFEFFFNIVKTKEIIKPFLVPEYIMLNVENFNNWFNDKNNNAIYAHPGIFLRTDKLCQANVLDYLEKCYGLTKDILLSDLITWSEPDAITKFYNKIIIDWRDKKCC